MRILIDIGHPAHVHLFKNFAKEMISRNHSVLFTCREKEFEKYLLENYGFEFISFGKKYNTRFGKLIGLIKFDLKEFIAGLKFKPDLFLSHGSMYAAHASALLRKPHISFEDTFNMEQVRLYLPFTEVVLTGNYEHPSLGKKEIRFNGYHELAYLHPNYFTPDKSVLNDLGISENEKYVVIRIVSWQATHDDGKYGLTHRQKLELIATLEKGMRVIISSEGKLPIEFERYQVNIAAEKLHDLLYYAYLYIGEGGTTANECALLGTPNVLINPLAKNIGLHQELKNKYETQYYFDDIKSAMPKILEIIGSSDFKTNFSVRSKRMIADKIDVTQFLINFVINYPGINIK